jgi:hypothetical protein
LNNLSFKFKLFLLVQYMELFRGERIARRIADARSRDVQLLHEVVFGTPGSISRAERNLLEFRGFEGDDSAIAQNRVLELAEEELKIVADLLMLELDRPAKELGRAVCQFLEGNHHQSNQSSSRSSEASFETRSVARSEEFRMRMQQLQQEEEQLLIQRQIRRNVELRREVDSMSGRGSERGERNVQEWLHRSGRSEEIRGSLARSQEDAESWHWSQSRTTLMRPNIANVSKLLTRPVLGTYLPKFSEDPKEWPTFITTYKRTTVDSGFSNSAAAQVP